MPCLHKFHQYTNLNRSYINPELNELEFEPITLIVGTFNPIWPNNNNADWFYGRVRNNYFWDVLPRLYNNPHNLRTGGHNHLDWKEFCVDNQIALTDLIYSINDADENNEEHQDVLRTYLDTSIADYFEDFTFIELTNILDQFTTITNVYLTRQDGIDLFDEQWNLVEEYRRLHPERNLHIRKLLTPSASARFQIRPYREANPQDRTPLRNFIYQSWQENWH